MPAKTVRGFLASRRRQGVESRSLARTLSALRVFFRWLETETSLKNHAMHRVQLPKIAHSVPKPLTVARAAEVVDGGMTAQLDWIAARDTAVLLLLYGAGLRICEALGIRTKDAPSADRDVLRVTGKGGKERLVPILPVTIAAIARYRSLVPFPLEPDEPMFRGANGGPLSPRIPSVRESRSASRVDRVGCGGRRDEAAAGRMEDDRPGEEEPVGSHVAAVPRRRGPFLRALRAAPRHRAGRARRRT